MGREVWVAHRLKDYVIAPKCQDGRRLPRPMESFQFVVNNIVKQQRQRQKGTTSAYPKFPGMPGELTFTSSSLYSSTYTLSLHPHQYSQRNIPPSWRRGRPFNPFHKHAILTSKLIQAFDIRKLDELVIVVRTILLGL